MARELNIRITGDDSHVNAALGRTEDKIGGLTKTTEQETAKQQEAFRRVGAAIGAAFSLQQLAQHAGKVTDLTGRLTDLSAKMGISIEAVQELGFAAKQQGGSIEQIGSALAIMGRNLTEGDKGVVDALGRMGLELDTLRAKAPDQAFTDIATAIAQIPDPMQRSQAAMALFGRSGAELLPLLTSDVAGLRQEARDLGLVIGGDLVRQGDRLGDLWDGQKMKVDRLRTEAMLPLLGVFTELPRWIQTVLVIGQEFIGLLGGIIAPLLIMVGPKALFATVVGWLGSLGGALGTAGSAIGTFVAAIGAVPLAFVAAGAALIYWKDEILRDLGHLFRLLPRAVEDMKQAILNTFAAMAGGAINWSLKLYEGVKTWLVDRFVGIVEGVKGAKDRVVGFFKDLYDKVVGRSWIPDLVMEIGQWMGPRLEQAMVAPVEHTLQRTSSLFSTFLNDITAKFDGWGNSLGGWVQSKIPGILGKGLGSITSGLLSSFSNLLTGGIAGLVQMGAQLAWTGLKKLGSAIVGLFKGEGAKTNDTRDEWMAKLGGLSGAHSLIASFGNDAQLMAAFEKAYFASNRDVFKQGQSAFENRLFELQSKSLLGGFGGSVEDPIGGEIPRWHGGMTTPDDGGQRIQPVTNVTVTFHVDTVDAASFRTWLQQGAVQRAIADAIIPALPEGLAAGGMA